MTSVSIAPIFMPWDAREAPIIACITMLSSYTIRTVMKAVPAAGKRKIRIAFVIDIGEAKEGTH